jgi:hypothetical protein
VQGVCSVVVPESVVLPYPTTEFGGHSLPGIKLFERRVTVGDLHAQADVHNYSS